MRMVEIDWSVDEPETVISRGILEASVGDGVSFFTSLIIGLI